MLSLQAAMWGMWDPVPTELVDFRQRVGRPGRRHGPQLSPEQAAAAAMVAEAKARGLELTGPNGLLKMFTKNVLETALNEEMTEHLGHEKNHAEAGRESTNVRATPLRGVSLRICVATFGYISGKAAEGVSDR
jgi:hypothetical protein